MNLHHKFMYIAWFAAMCINCTNIYKDSSQENDLTYKNKLQLLSGLMFMQFKSEGCQLNFNKISPDSLEFLTKNWETPKLVFFHSELNCNSCVEENIYLLNNFGNTIGNEHILFLTSYKNKRDLTLFRRINKIKSHIYNVSSIGLPIEELNYPFCFVINKEGKAECVFIPIKEDSLYFKRYLEMIKNKYF